MPCSKPIRRKYSKNEVILPSDRRGSMACHAVPRVMMYQGDARVPLEAEAILRGLRWWRTEVWNNGCFVRLGRCGIVIWRLIAHYYYWAGTSGVRPPCCSALLFGAWHVVPVAHEMTPHILFQNKQHPDQCISLFRATDGHLTCSYRCLSLPHRHKVMWQVNQEKRD